jgi:DNA-binding response OmpR family regulator
MQQNELHLLVHDAVGSLSGLLSAGVEGVEMVQMETLDGAVEALERCPADALLLNAVSPVALCELVEKARRQTYDTPIIGWSVPGPSNHAAEAGALAYLTKPVTRGDLQQALDAVGDPVRRVLLVDDDPDVLRLFERLLSVIDPSLQVSTAGSGEEALTMLDSVLPDLMLLDVVMSGMNGWQVLEEVQARRENSRPAVVLVSARDRLDASPQATVLAASMGTGLAVRSLMHYSLGLVSLLATPEL